MAENPMERVLVNRSKLDVPMICEECGSQHFYEQAVGRFARFGYDSATFRGLSQSPTGVKICVGCGTPVANASGARQGKTGERELLEESLKAGKAYRDARKPLAIESKLQNVVTAKDMERQIKRIVKRVLIDSGFGAEEEPLGIVPDDQDGKDAPEGSRQ